MSEATSYRDSRSSYRDPILPDVESFLRTTRISATAFGRLSVNDPTLVHRLRRGREIRHQTRSRIAAYLQAQRSAGP